MPLKPNNIKKNLSFEDYLTGIKDCNTAILSMSITLLESTKPEHNKIAEEIIEACIPLSGNSVRLGISGIPGVGKSTFIEALGMYLIENLNKKVAVLAIDPSSNKSKGSILGDKTRMNKLSSHKNAFVRPSPSSGALGGVAKATRETIILCEAAGYDVIIIETVGVGQSEIEVKSMVDFFLLLMLAGAGDELQGIKRGIMEIADAVIINKADGDNKSNAIKAVQEYKNAMHLFPSNDNGWTPKVDYCSAIENLNIEAVWKIIEDFILITSNSGWLNENRKQQSKFWLNQSINQELLNLFNGSARVKEELKQLEIKVINGKISPYKAAKSIINTFISDK